LDFLSAGIGIVLQRKLTGPQLLKKLDRSAVLNTVFKVTNNRHFSMLVHQSFKGHRTFFSAADDNALCAFKAAYPSASWRDIARMFPAFTPRQLRERWHNYLCPTIKTSCWTDADDRQLIRLYNEFGRSWKAIAKCMGNRSPPDVKNRFRAVQNRIGADDDQGPTPSVLPPIHLIAPREAEFIMEYSAPPIEIQSREERERRDEVTKTGDLSMIVSVRPPDTPTEFSVRGLLT
jgi:hypothetical protein